MPAARIHKRFFFPARFAYPFFITASVAIVASALSIYYRVLSVIIHVTRHGGIKLTSRCACIWLKFYAIMIIAKSVFK